MTNRRIDYFVWFWFYKVVVGLHFAWSNCYTGLIIKKKFSDGVVKSFSNLTRFTLTLFQPYLLHINLYFAGYIYRILLFNFGYNVHVVIFIL